MSHHTTLTERVFDWPPLPVARRFGRLSIEPFVPRRPSASRDSDGIVLRVASEDGSPDECVSLRSDEVDWLATFLPHTARGMRVERLFLQCQDMGYMPVRNEVLAAMAESAGIDPKDWPHG